MDSAVLAKSLGAGFATGICTLLFSTLTVLPASYMMNKFIYHGPVMRLMLGGLTAAFSLFSVVVMMVMVLSGRWKPVHYFGLAPLLKVTENPIEPVGYLAFFFKILYVLIHPLSMFYTGPEDQKGYIKALEPLMVHKDIQSVPMKMEVDGVMTDVSVTQGAVCEDFARASRFAGSIIDKKEWVRYMTMLQDSGIGKASFTPGAE